jgi:hypothetical protein
MCNRHEKIIVDAKYNMVELVDLAHGRKTHSSLDLNEEPMEGTNVDDWPTPIVKLPQACKHAQLLSNLHLSILQSFGCRCDERAIFYECN